MEDDTALGAIPYWFGEAQAITVTYNQTQNQAAALRPSFLARVGTMILSPLGIPLDSVVNAMKTIVTIVVIIAILYIVTQARGLFKGK